MEGTLSFPCPPVFLIMVALDQFYVLVNCIGRWYQMYTEILLVRLIRNATEPIVGEAMENADTTPFEVNFFDLQHTE